MTGTRRNWLSLAIIVLWPSAAGAQGDVQNGAHLAERMCSQCHVTGTATGGSDSAPPFPAIAATRSADYVRGFLANPHGGAAMPPFELTVREIEDVVAFMGLR